MICRDGACPVLVLVPCPCPLAPSSFLPRPCSYILLSSDVAVTGIRSEEIKAQKIHKPLQIAIVTYGFQNAKRVANRYTGNPNRKLRVSALACAGDTAGFSRWPS